MSTFRILNQAPQYLLPDGSVNAGGKLYFYETDLSTPKDTWSDPGATVLNSNPVIMDSAGRTITDVWGDGEYGVVMTDAEDVTVWTRNNVQAGAGSGTTLPAPEAGKFVYSADGATFTMLAVRDVPDPTGLTDYVLTSDGTAVPYWAPLPDVPDPPDPEIVVGADSFQAGVSTDPTKLLIQRGSDSTPASGTKTTTKAVVFATAYDVAPFVAITNRTGFITAAGTVQPTISIPTISTTGFTVQFSTETGESNSDNNIITTCNFDWFSAGNIEVP